MQRRAYLVLALVACGGKSHDERSHTSSGGNGAFAGVGGASGGASGGTAGDGAGMAGGGGRLIPQRLCEQREFDCIEDDACTCRDDPRPECQATRACVGESWTLTPGTCTEPPEPTPCPETPAAANDQPCLPEGTVCSYPGELSCVCMVPFDLDAHPCRIPSGPVGPLVRLWYCGGPGTGCSDGIHAVGSPCAEEDVACGDPCANEYARVCRGGLWEQRFPQTECL